jgi:hypothetical protein
MAALSPTITEHLIAASEIIHATARETVRTTPSAHRTLVHIDAAQPLMAAADALYEAAERIALGEAVDAPGLRLALRVADAKAAEGRSALTISD